METGKELGLEDAITFFTKLIGDSKEAAETFLSIVTNRAPGLFIDKCFACDLPLIIS